MQEYQHTMALVLKSPRKESRTGIPTLSKIGNYSKFDLRAERAFPIVTTKRTPIRSVISELLGFYRGVTSAAEFRALGTNVWNDNANKENDPGLPRNAWLDNPWRSGEDDLGSIYGHQWRRWEDIKLETGDKHNTMLAAGYTRLGQFQTPEGTMKHVWRREIDQLANAVRLIKEEPYSRRIMISAWNVGDLDRMALPPCHVLQQYICEEMSPADRVAAHIALRESAALWNNEPRDMPKEMILQDISSRFGTKGEPTHEYLDEIGAPRFNTHLLMYQRTADYMLGSPFNIASYAALLQIMCRTTGTSPGTLHYITGDTHLYENHLNAAREQLRRRPTGENARLLINPRLVTIEDFERASVDDFRLINYQSRGPLVNPTPMAL